MFEVASNISAVRVASSPQVVRGACILEGEGMKDIPSGGRVAWGNPRRLCRPSPCLLPPAFRGRSLGQNRPLPESVQFTLSKFERIWIADGSTLEALFRKLKSLSEVKTGKLAGKIAVLIDLVTRLPVAIWFKENPCASDTGFEDNLLELVSAQTLLLLDRGFDHFQFWQKLIEGGVHFITRIKINAAIEYQQVFTDGYALRDRLVRIGSGTKKTPAVTQSLIEIRKGKVWHSYLTSVLEPEILPPYVVIDLYQTRWRIEDAFNTVKRLLGLSYLWTGSINGIKLQVWATWLFSAVLVDLGDAVADELSLPFDRISLEMIYQPKVNNCALSRQTTRRGSDPFFCQSPSKPSLTASLQA